MAGYISLKNLWIYPVWVMLLAFSGGRIKAAKNPVYRPHNGEFKSSPQRGNPGRKSCVIKCLNEEEESS
jgi:hypothetical protein